MLYNPEWKVEAKPDVFSLEGLIAWLEKQPGEKEYDWTDTENCLCAQYFGHERWPSLHGEFEKRTRIRVDSIAAEEPWTFSAALSRARSALQVRE